MLVNRPTKAYGFLPIWKKGKDSKNPNTLPEYTMRPIQAPSNPRGDLRLARGLPAETLDRASRLSLARA